MATRVAIVDDDMWIRRGRAQALSEAPGIEVVATLDHMQASAQDDLWARVDVVLVDAWDHRAGFDRFPGVGVVRAIRSHPRGDSVRIVVVTGHLVNDMLRLRMAEAGADFFYAHEEVADLDRLLAVVHAAAGAPAPEHRRGVRVHPDRALDWIQEHGLEEAFGSARQKTLPFSRRTLGHIRREVGNRAGLTDPGRLTPWRQVVSFVNRARGAELRRPEDADPASPSDD